jgi:SPP1 family predicted phage head-tail adaptor
MQAGKLDRTITLQRKAETVSATGATVTAWTTLATVRAEIVTASTSEFLTDFGEAENDDSTFRIRYLAGITTADRIVYEGKAFNIKKIVEIGRRRGLELRAVATR